LYERFVHYEKKRLFQYFFTGEDSYVRKSIYLAGEGISSEEKAFPSWVKECTVRTNATGIVG
jgi:hypothetical protein